MDATLKYIMEHSSCWTTFHLCELVWQRCLQFTL